MMALRQIALACALLWSSITPAMAAVSGDACSVDGRTVKSTNATEGILSCRSGSYVTAGSTSGTLAVGGLTVGGQTLTATQISILNSLSVTQTSGSACTASTQIVGRASDGSLLVCNPNTSKWTALSSGGNSSSCTGGSQIFTTSGTFTAPTGCTSYKLLVVGGGGGGHQPDYNGPYRGGASGAVRVASVTLNPGDAVTVTIGRGAQNSGNGASGGESSSFGSLLTAGGGKSGDDGGTGGSGGGGGGGNTGAGAGGTSGGPGANGYRDGNLSMTGGAGGTWDLVNGFFTRNTFSGGSGGAGGGPSSDGRSGDSPLRGGGGGGGVLVNGAGPSGGTGSQGIYGGGGSGGSGYGAGGGAGGGNGGGGGGGGWTAGANGVVYVEW